MTSWLVWVVFDGIRRTSHDKSRRLTHSSALRNKNFRGGAKMEALFKFTLLAVEYEVRPQTFNYRMHPHRFW